MDNKTKRYLGVDWGEKRIGLALADSSAKTAIPIETVSTTKEVCDLVGREDIDLVILGDPVKMSGQASDNKGLDDFARVVSEETGRELLRLDERLTSKGADSLPGSKKQKASRDSLAAMLILQSFLDSQNNG